MLHITDLSYRIGERLILDGAGARLAAGLARRARRPQRRRQDDAVPASSTARSPPRSAARSRCRATRASAPSPRRRRAGPRRSSRSCSRPTRERAALLAEAETAEGMRRAEIETRLTDIGAHAAPARAADDPARARLRFGGAGSGPAPTSPAAGACASRSRPCSSPSPTCCCSTSRRTISISKARSGSTTTWPSYPHTVLVISHDRDLLDRLGRPHPLSRARQADALPRQLLLLRTAIRREASARRRSRRRSRRPSASTSRPSSTASGPRPRRRARRSRASSASPRWSRSSVVDRRDDAALRPALARSGRSPRPSSPSKASRRATATRRCSKRLDLTILPDDRIALLGANGNGKSTFCKLIGGRLDAAVGQMTRSSKLDVAYFAQHQLDELRPRATPFIHVGERMPDSAGGADPGRAARRSAFPARKADTPISSALRRREGAAADGARGLQRPAPAHPRRADEPPRHRQPHRADGGDQRLRGRGHPRQPRPLPDRGLRRPALARRRRRREALRRRHGRLPPPRPVGRGGDARRGRKAEERGLDKRGRAPRSPPSAARAARLCGRSCRRSRPHGRSSATPSPRSTRRWPTAAPMRRTPPRRTNSPRCAARRRTRWRRPRRNGWRSRARSSRRRPERDRQSSRTLRRSDPGP